MRTSIIAVVIAMVLPGFAIAEEAPERAAGVCRAEVDEICGKVAGPARRECVSDNVAKLSPQCQELHQQRAAKAGNEKKSGKKKERKQK